MEDDVGGAALRHQLGALVAIACWAGLVVAARVARRSRALAPNGPATFVFAALAILNFLG